MSLAFYSQSACKVLVASGVPKSETHLILRTLLREQKGSGTEFVKDRLKSLKTYLENKIVQQPTKLLWFKKTRSGHIKDRGWRALVTSDPRKGLQNVSCLIMSLERQPDQKTKDDIYDNILRSDRLNESVVARFVKPRRDLRFHKFYGAEIRRYSPATLKGVSFPLYMGHNYRVKTDKLGNKDKDSVLTMYLESLCSAPEMLADHYVRLHEIFNEAAERFAVDENLYNRYKGFSDYYLNIQDIIRVEAFSNCSNLEESYGGDLSKVTNPHVVGKISVIPSPGMKDRVIANPNAAIQAALYNFGERLADVTYRNKSCFVKNQEAGMAKIQGYLKQGITLASIDMSAATDRLSADAGWSLIQNMIDDQIGNSFMKEVISEELAFFKTVSRSAFYIGDLGTDGVEYVSYTQGQPMGLKPSFPMLTLMNLKAGLDARDTAGSSVDPIVVGDDIVIDASTLPHYLETIEGLGGKINLDKTLISNKFAKFCSRIITPTEIIREKPRYVEGDRIRNALELGNLSILKPWEKQIVLSAASQAIPDLDNININVNRTKLVDRIQDRAVQRLLDMDLGAGLIELSPELARLNLELRSDEVSDFRKDQEAHRRAMYQYETGEDIDEVFSPTSMIDHLSKVEIPVKVTKYDHHEDKHGVATSEMKRMRKISKSNRRGEVSQASYDHHVGHILYDKDTVLFEPKGSGTVFDITDQVRQQSQKIVEEVASKPRRTPSSPSVSDWCIPDLGMGPDDDDGFSL